MEYHIGSISSGGQLYACWGSGSSVYSTCVQGLNPEDVLSELKANLYALYMVLYHDRKKGMVTYILTSSVKLVASIRDGSYYGDYSVWALRNMIKIMHKDRKRELKPLPTVRFKMISKEDNPSCQKDPKTMT
mgnify:CR=1 FL=1